MSKRMGFRLATAGFVLALIGCGTLSAGGSSPGNVPKRPPLGLISPFGGRGVVLSKLDPLTLRPIGRRVQVGEYHDAWSFSPRYAYALNSRALRIVAIGSGKVVHRSRRPPRVEEIELIAPTP